MGVAQPTALSVVLAEMIHVDGLSGRLAESPRLVRVIKLSKMVPLGYTPPPTTANKCIGGDLLDKSLAKARRHQQDAHPRERRV